MTSTTRLRRRAFKERLELLERLESWLETPMLVLAFVWLALLLIELTRGDSPALSALGTAIWIVFVVDFVVKLALAPAKLAYVRANWLTAIALLLPALRLFRIARVLRVLRYARAARGVRLVRVLASINRGTRALGRTFSRSGFGYVAAVTALVTLIGAAGMYAFESDAGGLTDYGSALWWTAMIMTTMGSEYWPRTAEGRLLCLVLALYAFAVFGYVTATIASFLLGRRDERPEDATREAIRGLRAELAALREDVARLDVSRQTQGKEG